MRIIGIGDNTIDYYQDLDLMFPGGNTVNVVVLCKQFGAESGSYIGVLGNDYRSEHLLNCMEKEQIDLSRIRRVYGPNGEAVVTLDEDGDRIFVETKIGVKGLVAIRLSEEDLQFVNEHDLVHTSVYSYMERELPKLKKPISFDFSHEKNDNYLQFVCPYVTFAFFSGSELSKAECLEFIKKVHSMGPKVVGVTRGSKGALFSDGQKVYEQAIVEADQVVDTLGAGDSFIAAFLVHYDSSQDMEKALKKAADAASKIVSRYGAFGFGAVKNVAEVKK
jgi:fructoselysine 6-kinase